MIKQKRNESIPNYLERKRLYVKSCKIKGTESIEEYKEFLEKEQIEYMEFKSNNKKIQFVIPVCQFKVMSKADINKLFKVIK